MASVKFSTGLVAGLLLGLLFAPERGQETRKKVVAAADSIKERVNNLFAGKADEMEDLKAILENDMEEIDHASRQRLLRLVQEHDQHRSWFRRSLS